jgi:hypothetical protein
MKYLLLFFLLTAGGDQICFYGTTPPSQSELNDEPVRFSLKLTGFTPHATVKLHYVVDTTIYQVDDSMKTDNAGSYFRTIKLAGNAKSLSYIVFVDQDVNSVWTEKDFGSLQENLAVSSDTKLATETLTYKNGTLSSVSLLYSSPASGKYTCIYTPKNWPVYVEQGMSLANTSGLPFSQISSEKFMPAAIPVGTYREECILDDNSNDTFEPNEKIVSSREVTPEGGSGL